MYKTDDNCNIKLDLTKKVNFEFWEERVCPICGTHFYARKKYEKITCSKQCYDKYVEIHKVEIRKKVSESLKRTNAKRPKEKKQEELRKARETCLKKYGVDMYQKTDEYRQKISKLFKEKDWSNRSAKIKEQLKEKYEKICQEDNLKLLDFRGRFDATVQCQKCGHTFDVHVLGYLSPQATHNLCRHCHPFGNLCYNSTKSKFVEEILKENNIEYYKNDRQILNGFEIDFVIPSLSLGIEVNGNYWHAEFAAGKEKNYHINKTKQAFEKGYKLIHIFEDEIEYKPEIVKSRLLNLLGKTPQTIYARKCEIKEISPAQKTKFFNENHMDGDSLSKYNIALIYNGEIISVAAFGKRMISKRPSFELIRFATKKFTNVVGGFSKILKYVTTTYDISEITTYADIRWSGMDWENNFYQKNGFEFSNYTQPNYFYVDKKNYLIRLNRMNFQKKKLVEEGFDASKTETQIMVERGFDRLWDCGSMKFVYKKRD